MRGFRSYMVLVGVLIATASIAGSKAAAVAPKAAAPTKVTKITEGRAVIEYRLEILERASANRELAAITQMEQMRDLEKQAKDLEEAGPTEADGGIKAFYKKIGKLETDAALLGGLASANFDKAAVNRKSVEALSSRLDKAEQTRSSRAYAKNLTIQANEAMRLASIACERAAVAYDKADEPTLVATSSQTAAVWLEKLATR